ncbi:hypothetical protein LTSEGIV_0844 [Salmonella enterica subsp. enterica serovar Give str. S5-487]|nr:hypothetical protein LTSEGIV_0844 [Salmonella enterica subsp. enterica serovar Give str. S5-487]
MLAAEQHVVTPALERVIEANTYLSGVGFAVGRISVSVIRHKIYNRSKRSRFITFTHAATKSFTNFSCASLHA